MKIKVAIFCLAYNHENFIAKALDGFLMQETDFDFQVIIGEDCSTDNTASIIKEYAEKYPHIIKPVFQEKNIGVYRNALETFKRIKAEYVAMCEGDDYWTDPLKLQKQVDFLDNNPDFTICFHPAYVDFDGKVGAEIIPDPSVFKKCEYTFGDILTNNIIPTTSCVYRWNTISAENISEFFPKLEIVPLDWFLHILHAKHGCIRCMDEVMSVYRKHEGGMWQADPETLNLRYGVQQVRFFWAVYEQVASCSTNYYETKLEPFFSKTLVLYLKHGEIEKIGLLRSNYPELYDVVSKKICTTIGFEIRIRAFLAQFRLLRKFAAVQIDDVWSRARKMRRFWLNLLFK